ncbi:MAG: M20 family metallopeptidase [Bacteroidales bacterium]|nr:M20 family metallopeptidase [Bacteroidales bacterium]
MESLKNAIRTLARQYQPRVVAIRRHLHTHPELSGDEKQTAAYIVQHLKEHHIPFRENVGGYGVVARIEGKNPEKSTVALRADMDALNITEATGLPFSSQNHGVMHACGHDFHTANLMGTAFILNQLKTQFEGTVMLIFQPSEEKIPSGALQMLEAGIFEDSRPQAIFALHVDPGIDTGRIGVRSGAFLAAADELFITIHGKGGHGAYPYKCVDPVVIAAQTILSLQTVVSRSVDPLHPAVVSIGRIEGLGNTNIIPDEVTMRGTIRTFNNAWRETIHRRITELILHTAHAFGGDATVEIKKGYPPVVNDAALTQRTVKTLETFFGKENIEESAMRMGADDFAFFAQEVPATYLRLGVRPKNTPTGALLHQASFNPDEDALETGMTAMSGLAVLECETCHI